MRGPIGHDGSLQSSPSFVHNHTGKITRHDRPFTVYTLASLNSVHVWRGNARLLPVTPCYHRRIRSKRHPHRYPSGSPGRGPLWTLGARRGETRTAFFFSERRVKLSTSDANHYFSLPKHVLKVNNPNHQSFNSCFIARAVFRWRLQYMTSWES